MSDIPRGWKNTPHWHGKGMRCEACRSAGRIEMAAEVLATLERLYCRHVVGGHPQLAFIKAEKAVLKLLEAEKGGDE